MILAMCMCASAVIASDFKKSVTPFPEKILGQWTPTETPQSILGPLAYDFINGAHGAISAFRDDKTGDVWWTLLDGQVFHVTGNQMQVGPLDTAFWICKIHLIASPTSIRSTASETRDYWWSRVHSLFTQLGRTMQLSAGVMAC
jgi:hypothetical protein